MAMRFFSYTVTSEHFQGRVLSGLKKIVLFSESSVSKKSPSAEITQGHDLLGSKKIS